MIADWEGSDELYREFATRLVQRVLANVTNAGGYPMVVRYLALEPFTGWKPLREDAPVSEVMQSVEYVRKDIADAAMVKRAANTTVDGDIGECRYCANTGWFYGEPDLQTFCGCAFGKLREELSASPRPAIPGGGDDAEVEMPTFIWAGDFDGQGFGHCVAGPQGGLYEEYVRKDIADAERKKLQDENEQLQFELHERAILDAPHTD